MKNSSSALISFILLVCLQLTSASVRNPKPKCQHQDQKVIQQIQASFGINFTGDCCDWNLVVCTFYPPYSRVTMFLAINDSNISGQIPATIGDLPYLEYIQFSNIPNLTGSIPPAVAKLSKLISLVITSTGISGPIPTFHENITSFASLELRDNALTGPIPSELPIWFPNLNALNLANNSFTGTIPKSLANLDPYYIDLSGNNFYGDASPLFGENKTTNNLYLDRNRFNFDLSKVHFSPNLTTLSLSYNNIFGSLPQELTQLPFLTKLDVSHNMLCGEIPQGGHLQAFKSNSFSHNKCLCGAPLPSCVK